MNILDVTSDRSGLVNGAAALLHDAFHNRTAGWHDLDAAQQEVFESLKEGRISRVAVDESDGVLGWIGGIPTYSGHVWEIHPLVVTAQHRRPRRRPGVGSGPRKYREPEGRAHAVGGER